jgi:enamine deaminase RidA (YjgF/YER057c/UK114 family)
MAHTYITSGDGVPSGDWPFSAAVVQAGALPMGCKVEVQAIAAHP